MSDLEHNRRLNDILDMIGRIAALDFSRTLPTSDKNDMMDAITLGLNMLSEELNANVVEKAKLDFVNSKLEKFAYTTAHDLKSPLNSITGLLNLVEDCIKPEEKSDVYIYISQLKKTTEQMKALVEGILIYSKAGTYKIEQEEIDLNEAFKEIIEMDHISNDADIQMKGVLPHVIFNRTAIYQVIRNLLSNAVKYSDKDICRIEVQAEERDEFYQIMVSDNGKGIALENQEIIFEIFNKIHDTTKIDSHGIGLATVKGILESAGERIWVESALGEGATFHFTLKKSGSSVNK